MKRNVRYLLFLLLVPLLAACDQATDASLSFTDVPIRVNTSVEGGGSTYAAGDEAAWVGEELPAKLFFWHAKDFDALKSTSTNTPTPYFTYLMNDAITSFSFKDSRWLDTGHPYPENPDKTEAYVYATGYAPRTLLKEDATSGFRTLTVTETDLQKVAHCDFLSCDARSKQKGSFENPFGNTAVNELQFRHLTSKILVYASRHETITGQVYVRKVKATLTLNNENGKNEKFHVPSVIEWTDAASGVNTEWGYQVTEYQKLENGLTFKDNTDDMIMVLQDKRIDSCYVCQPTTVTTTAVDLSVTAQYSYLQDFSLPYKFKWSGKDLSIKAIGENGKETTNPITEFKPGYVYEIYLKFYKTGVIVTAKEVEWKDGGIHYVPVYPPGSSSDDTPSGT